MAMRFPQGRLIVFAKAPIAGQAKTRLIPTLGAQGAARLQAQLIRHTLASVGGARLCPLELWCAPDCSDALFQQYRDTFGLTLFEQAGADLGARMRHAFEHALRRASYAVIIGTDCPALQIEDIAQALRGLDEGLDAVIGPAEDGGYVLLGLRRAAPPLFESIAWGGAEVCRTTLDRMDALGWHYRVLAPRWDVDRAQDYERLQGAGLLRDFTPPAD